MLTASTRLQGHKPGKRRRGSNERSTESQNGDILSASNLPELQSTKPMCQQVRQNVRADLLSQPTNYHTRCTPSSGVLAVATNLPSSARILTAVGSVAISSRPSPGTCTVERTRTGRAGNQLRTTSVHRQAAGSVAISSRPSPAPAG